MSYLSRESGYSIQLLLTKYVMGIGIASIGMGTNILIFVEEH